MAKNAVLVGVMCQRSSIALRPASQRPQVLFRGVPPTGPTVGWWHHRSRRSTHKPGRAPPTNETGSYPASPALENRPAVRATRGWSSRAGRTAAPGSPTAARFHGSPTIPPGPSVRRPGARSPHTAAVHAPQSAVRTRRPACGSIDGLATRALRHRPRAFA